MIILPQMPVINRYQEEWISMWENELKKLGITPKIIGERKPQKIDRSKNYNFFTNTKEAVIYECDQITKLMKTVKPNDKILVLDADFPGLTTPVLQIVKLMYPNTKLYAYLHAGSWCNGDIFKTIPSKKYSERAIFDLFDKVFVATKYHKVKIETYFNECFNNIKIVGLPFYKKEILKYIKNPISYKNKKLIFINGRPEQSNTDLVSKLTTLFPNEVFVTTQKYECCGKIKNLKLIQISNRKEYFNLLNMSKIMISIKNEETFGLGALEAQTLNCIPLCPNNFSYPEIIKYPELLYNNKEDLVTKLKYLLTLTKNPFTNNISSYEKVIKKICKEL